MLTHDGDKLSAAQRNGQNFYNNIIFCVPLLYQSTMVTDTKSMPYIYYTGRDQDRH